MIDAGSETWREIERWAQEQIANAETVVLAEGADQREADVARGRRSLALQLLKLTEPKPDLSGMSPQSSTKDNL